MSTPIDCTITFIGTATTLLRLGGFTLLTDPNFVRKGQWVSVSPGLLGRRRTDPAIGIDELPELDALLLSHLHGDHFDRVARRGLRRDLPVFTTPSAARKLHKTGFTESVPMPTWAERELSTDGQRLKITALPGQHVRGLLRAVVPPVMGTLVEYQSGPGARTLRIYFSGDTLMHQDLAQISRRFPEIDLAVLHLGGTRAFGVLLTMDGEQGVQLLDLLRPAQAVPVHYDDYGLFKSPLSDFQTRAAAHSPAAVHYLTRGITYPLPLPDQGTIRSAS